MRTEMIISQTEATTASARASMSRCLAYVPVTKWFDTITGKHAVFAINPPGGPGAPS